MAELLNISTVKEADVPEPAPRGKQSPYAEHFGGDWKRFELAKGQDLKKVQSSIRTAAANRRCRVNIRTSADEPRVLWFRGTPK